MSEQKLERIGNEFMLLTKEDATTRQKAIFYRSLSTITGFILISLIVSVALIMYVFNQQVPIAFPIAATVDVLVLFGSVSMYKNKLSQLNLSKIE